MRVTGIKTLDMDRVRDRNDDRDRAVGFDRIPAEHDHLSRACLLAALGGVKPCTELLQQPSPPPLPQSLRYPQHFSTIHF